MRLKIFIIAIIWSFNCYSQDRIHNLSTILEFGGSSGFYSINGEYRFALKKTYNINTKIGFGYLPQKGTEFITIPVGLSILNAKGKHHIESGIGMSYIKGLHLKPFMRGEIITYYPDNALYFTPSIGYRYDNLQKGIIIKIYYSPLIVIHDFFNEDEYISAVSEGGVFFGGVTAKDWFYYFYNESLFPTAQNTLGYFGISVGYRL